MSTQTADRVLPLNDVMLAMDVVDTLRHRGNLVSRELDTASREKQLIARLREIYRQQGIEVPDHILKEGVAALDESRFVYTPPAAGLSRSLARLYVTRSQWGRWLAGGLMALILAVGGYFLGYLPYKASVAEQARIELAETLPAQMDTLYGAIFTETKVQTAVTQAGALRQRGKIAAKEGDRTGADAAIAGLTELRDRIRLYYTLKVVNREGVRSGFWTFPEINTDATNYYIVVEALTDTGEALSLPILNEENGETEFVSIWGLRVSQGVYNAVSADKADNGIIERNIVGRKQYGFLEVDYVVPALGGTVTRW